VRGDPPLALRLQGERPRHKSPPRTDQWPPRLFRIGGAGLLAPFIPLIDDDNNRRLTARSAAILDSVQYQSALPRRPGFVFCGSFFWSLRLLTVRFSSRRLSVLLSRPAGRIDAPRAQSEQQLMRWVKIDVAPHGLTRARLIPRS
jgi:hypothetical protein